MEESLLILLIGPLGGALVGAIIGNYIYQNLNYKNNISLMKEKWKFNWKVRSFREIANKINNKVHFYENITKELKYGEKIGKQINKTEMEKEVNLEMLQNKINDDDFFIFSKYGRVLLKMNLDFMIKEVYICMQIKEFLKKGNDEMLFSISTEIGNLKILKSRLLKEMSKQII